MTVTEENSGRKQGSTEKRLFAACLFLILAGGLLLTAGRIPGFAQWYTVQVYARLTAVYGRVMGWIPFSVSEAGLYVLLLFLPGTGILALWKALRKKEGAILLRWASGAFLTASVLLFLYAANCGVNYRRTSFSEESGIGTETGTAEKLQEVCIWLNEEVDARAEIVRRNKSGEMRLGKKEQDTAIEAEGKKQDTSAEEKQAERKKKRLPLGEAAVQAMRKLAQEYPELKGYYPLPKPVYVSEILSYQGLTGVYSPFTMEANYNQDMPDYNVPFTACHELSHLRGFMQEEEANFIAFLACTESERIDFQYSGYLTAWIYSMNALRRADPVLWQEVRDRLPKAVEADLQENSRFWDSYEGKISEMSDRMNDAYLKVNGQSAGIQSYGKMVDLLIAYYEIRS